MVERSSPFGLGRRGYAFLAIGGAAIGAYGLVGPGVVGDTLFLAICLASSLVVLNRVRNGGLQVPRAWRAIGVALAMIAIADLMVALHGVAGLGTLGFLAEFLFMAAYVPLFAAAVCFSRPTRTSDGTAVLDSGILGLAIAPILYEWLVEPNLGNAVIGPESIAALAVPLIDVVLLSLVAPLLVMRYARSVSAFLLVAGLSMLAIGDATFAARSLGGLDGWDPGVNLAWLASYVLLGAAALVPSSQALGEIRDPRSGERDTGRLLVLALALVVLPIVMVIETLLDKLPDLLFFDLAEVAIAVLVVVRVRRSIAQLVDADLRFRRFMDRSGIFAVIKDAAGRYLYMNPTAAAGREDPDSDWYGRTDAQLSVPEIAAQRTREDAMLRAGAQIVETVEIGGQTWHLDRFPLPGTGGDVAAFGLDISDLASAQRELLFQARLLESVRDVVVVLSPQFAVTYWNQGAAAILGCTADEMLGATMDRFVPDDGREEIAAQWAAVAAGTTDSLEWRAVARDGTIVWLDFRVTPLTGDDGAPSGYLGVGKDVTARKQAELELARLGKAIDNANDAVIVTDADDRVVYVNPAFERMTGFRADEVRGRRPSDDPAGAEFAIALGRAKGNVDGWRGDIVDHRRNGSELVAETSISQIKLEGQPAAGYVTIKRDVTRERAAEQTAEREARERRVMAEALANLQTGATVEDTAAAVCRELLRIHEIVLATLITFDDAGVATVVGQAARGGETMPGLRLPRSRSSYLRERAAGGPWVERWAPGPDHPYARILAEAGIVAHAYAPIVDDGRPVALLIAGSDGDNALEQLTSRLSALVEFASITRALLAGQVNARLATEAAQARIHELIEAGELTPVFQPIVDLATGDVRGYEALTRFADGTAPDVHIERAHTLGLGLQLEAACLKAAIEASAALPEGAWLNLNVSPQVILTASLPDILTGDREIVLEITEHEAITDYEAFRAAVAPMRNRVRLAIDDAGAGYASLRHIVELQPAFVKLDRTLIAGIDGDGARQAVVAGMVRFAETAGLTLIAEGIETVGELVALRRLGSMLGQGFLLGRPEAIKGDRRRSPRSRVVGRAA